MDLLKSLEKNKGMVSSEFGKKIGARIAAQEDAALLAQAVKYCAYALSDKKAKNVRAGAGKIVEVVAFTRPDMVAPFLNDLLPGLSPAEKALVLDFAKGYEEHPRKKTRDRVKALLNMHAVPKKDPRP
jgi:hypothetical protein